MEQLLSGIRTIKNGRIEISFEKGKPTYLKVFEPFEPLDIPEILPETDLERLLFAKYQNGKLLVDIRDGLINSKPLEGSYFGIKLT